MRHGSLFSGIGGFDLAAEWMGWENVFHCEWNPFGQKVLKYYWPNAVSYDDITKTNFAIWRGRIDILTGGFPCQPFSLAGQRKGTEDDRHLWPEMLRAIRECRPTWIVGENVPGLINWNEGLVFEQVCAELEGEGYEVQPIVLPASGVNAPHRRDRVWIVACNATGNTGRENAQSGPIGYSESQPAEIFQQQEHFSIRFGAVPTNNEPFADIELHRQDIEQLCKEQDAAYTGNTRLEGSENRGSIRGSRENRHEQPTGLFRTDWQDFPTVAPICHGNDGIPTGLDGITFSKWRNKSIKAGGNAIVPQVALQLFKAIEQFNQTRPDKDGAKDRKYEHRTEPPER